MVHSNPSSQFILVESQDRLQYSIFIRGSNCGKERSTLNVYLYEVGYFNSACSGARNEADQVDTCLFLTSVRL